MGSHTLNIHERFLRHIWNRQYLRQEELQTSDGRRLHVLHAGRLNSDGGPDVRDAVLQIGGVMYHGDVEIHRTVVDWIHHQHHEDPRYNKVVLHVVLERPPGDGTTIVPSGRQIPVLVLEPFLSESIHSLWQRTILDERLHSQRAIPCSGRNQTVPKELLRDWIQHLAVERLELKLRRFDERLRELAQVRLHTVREHFPHNVQWRIEGNSDDLPPPQRELSQRDLANRDHWDQLLYEGLMEGLGYSKNREPFLRLSRSVTLREVRAQHIEDNEIATQALLLGAAGLLPRIGDLHHKESRSFARQLIKEWKARKKLYRSAILHPAHWQFFPTRPSNFPTLRIAAASVLVKRILYEDLFRNLIETLKSHDRGAEAFRSIREYLIVTPHPFWTTHYQFDHPAAKQTQALGPERIGDLITNTVIPLALLYARIFRDRLARERTLQLFYAAPTATGNSITKLMDKHLLRGAVGVTTVSGQQGVIQLYKYYCLEGRCAECAVGGVVRTENSGRENERSEGSLIPSR
jgi:hypothetical protein